MTTSRLPDLSVVIPTWNGVDLLRAHLPSVVAAAVEIGRAEVIVSDDGSTDDTVPSLEASFEGVRFVRREENGGFAHAANAGVDAARAPTVVLLNNDIEVRAGALSRLANALASDRSIFAAVPSIVRTATGIEEGRTRIRFARGVISTDLRGEPGDDPAYACGGAMAFRREDFVALGGFDPRFAPFYWEDVDLSYRARKRGRRVVFVPDARVDHDHGRTIGTRFLARAVSRIYERNRLLFTWKNLTDPTLRAAHWGLLPAKLAWNLAAHPAFVAGFRDAWPLRSEVRGVREIERTNAVVRDRDLLE